MWAAIAHLAALAAVGFVAMVIMLGVRVDRLERERDA